MHKVTADPVPGPHRRDPRKHWRHPGGRTREVSRPHHPARSRLEALYTIVSCQAAARRAHGDLRSILPRAAAATEHKANADRKPRNLVIAYDHFAQYLPDLPQT